jgi:hypothetical protein
MRRALALSIPLLFLPAACTYDNGDAQHFAVDPVNSDLQCGTQAQSTIDTDATIVIDAGKGAGVYVEYGSGGHWRVRTSCDTKCPWDIIVTPDAGHALSNVVPEDLEPADRLYPYDDGAGSYNLVATTASDIDGFTFDSDPGAAIQLDTLLGGSCSEAEPFVFWEGDGALHPGAPSNPLTLVPSAK